MLLIIKNYGPLRIVLAFTMLFLIVFVPNVGTLETYEGTDAVFNTVVPALTPIIFMVLLLDALMSLVMIDGKTGTGRKISKRNSIISFSLAIILLLVWVPFFGDLLGLL